MWFFGRRLRCRLLKHKDLRPVLILKMKLAGSAILSCPNVTATMFAQMVIVFIDLFVFRCCFLLLWVYFGTSSLVRIVDSGEKKI